MIKQVKITESDLHAIIKGTLCALFEEAQSKMDDSIETVEEGEEFNEQPTNDIVGENKKMFKVNETQLKDIVKESVLRVLIESGELHPSGAGKYGLAMDAASKARALGRREQAANLTRHGANAFNQQYSTDNFEMDDYGQLRQKGEDGIERMYRPQSKMNNSYNKDNVQDWKAKNYQIKNFARTAKAFPRKKMTGGLDAVDKVDKYIHGNNA